MVAIGNLDYKQQSWDDNVWRKHKDTEHLKTPTVSLPDLCPKPQCHFSRWPYIYRAIPCGVHGTVYCWGPVCSIQNLYFSSLRYLPGPQYLLSNIMMCFLLCYIVFYYYLWGVELYPEVYGSDNENCTFLLCLFDKTYCDQILLNLKYILKYFKL